MQTLEEVIQQLHKRGVTVKLCEAGKRVLAKLSKAGVIETIGAHNYHADFASALAACGEREAAPAAP
jgi:SulP family sulfate permease